MAAVQILKSKGTEIFMLNTVKWIEPGRDFGEICPEFQRSFRAEGDLKSALLHITAQGVYEAELNGVRVGDYRLAPGWTAYEKRIQYQTYDVTDLFKSGLNSLTVTVGKGWSRGRIVAMVKKSEPKPAAIAAKLVITRGDGSVNVIETDEKWRVRESRVLFSDLYDGEIYDAAKEQGEYEPVRLAAGCGAAELILQEGEKICTHEKIFPKRIFTAPNGETIIDFGQNFAGLIETRVTAKAHDEVDLSFGETLDCDGNFYNENYRSAKCMYKYICREGENVYVPHFTFYGFRYVRVNKFPEKPTLASFVGICLYSDIRQTGFIECAHEGLSGFIHNAFWSQKSNFIDVPTDCPQRDERQGWTGDAQVFAKTACYNFDVGKFFKKWINDVVAQQFENGAIARIVPNSWGEKPGAAVWGDSITIIPWEVYSAYGDEEILKNSYSAMKKWVDYIASDTLSEFLWTASEEDKRKRQYGDWLALDAPYGSLKGASDENLIASAFYANSVDILVKTGRVLGEDMSDYEELYKNIALTFKKHFNKFNTQTECVLALHFNLTDDRGKTAALLVEKIKECGGHIQTGFVGTPYILHALSNNGYADVAYDLLLREEFPSWLYPLKHGATTIWEHMDGIRDDKSMWSAEMNSFNHYAFGSVLDWVYSVSAGITPSKAGYKSVKISPLPDKRLGKLSVRLSTVHGEIISKWYYRGNDVFYEITTPVAAQIHIGEAVYSVERGSYMFAENGN